MRCPGGAGVRTPMRLPASRAPHRENRPQIYLKPVTSRTGSYHPAYMAYALDLVFLGPAIGAVITSMYALQAARHSTAIQLHAS